MKQEVGYYLHQEGPNLGKHHVPIVSCYLRSSDTQLGTPYPRSAGFDTDIGAFIESSVVFSTEGSMARLVIDNGTVSGDTFLPGQLFVFGGFMLCARSTVHLEQVDSFTPGHQIRFGSLNYITNIR